MVHSGKSRYFFHKHIFREILELHREDEKKPLAGLLFGIREKKEEGNLIEIDAFVPIQDILGDTSPTLYTEETFLGAFNHDRVKLGGKVLVGWFSVHRRGINATNREVTTHKTYFRHPLQALAVIDAHASDVLGYMMDKGRLVSQEIFLATDPASKEDQPMDEMKRKLTFQEKQMALAKRKAEIAEQKAMEHEKALNEERKQRTKLMAKMDELKGKYSRMADTPDLSDSLKKSLEERDRTLEKMAREVTEKSVQKMGEMLDAFEQEYVKKQAEIKRTQKRTEEMRAQKADEKAAEKPAPTKEPEKTEKTKNIVSMNRKKEEEPGSKHARTTMSIMQTKKAFAYRKVALVAMPLLLVIASMVVIGMLISGNSGLRQAASIDKEGTELAMSSTTNDEEDASAETLFETPAETTAPDKGDDFGSAEEFGTSETVTPEPETPAPLALRPELLPEETSEPEPTPEPMKEPISNTYTIQAGDSLWVIAKKTLGAGSKWKLIADANGLTETSILKIGAKLVIPAPPGDETASPADNGVEWK